MKTIIHLFGSTGDLTYRKLLPSIARLYNGGFINKNIKVIAIGRRDYTTEEYLDHELINNEDDSIKNTLEKIVEYYEMQITDFNDYLKYHDHIKKYINDETEQIYYLALAPHFINDVTTYLSQARLIDKGNNLCRIIFEKPFGSNLKDAIQLNKHLSNYFTESQIYRIDHYLGKEMVRNLLTLRKDNIVINSLWNKEYIKHIKIYLKEEDGILTRGQYYDLSGAIKDMFQSHILQILALIGLELPLEINDKSLKKAKEDLLKSITFNQNSLIKGQYHGYRNEDNVKPDSLTETFFFIESVINNKLLNKVPVYLLSGKAIGEKKSLIEIEFRNTNYNNDNQTPNILEIQIDPINEVKFIINSNELGLTETVSKLNLSNIDTCSDLTGSTEAYEKLLLDSINNDQTLFVSWNEIRLSWELAEKILAIKTDLVVYKDEKEILNKVHKLINNLKGIDYD